MKILYITNIPAPYRQKRFNLMQEIFPDYGIEFEVLYMAEREPNRKWVIPKESYKYQYKIFKGLHPTVGNFYVHFNPGLLLRLLKSDYDMAIIGGMANPTLWLAPFFISRKKIKIISIESNLLSAARKHGIAAKFKNILLDKADAYQVTGNPQKEYIQFFSNESKKKTFVKLPNLIDESLFRDEVALLKKRKAKLRTSMGVLGNKKIWILPARLIEIKGILPFLQLLKGIEQIHLFILGEGVLHNEILDVAARNDLNITVTGFVQQDEILKYYASADLFVLPSLKDSSPLSPIEAIAAGLPILVSSRIGNLEDVLVDGKNGWCYDPVSEKEKGRNLVLKISSMDQNNLAKVGEESNKRYQSVFDNEKIITKFAGDLKGLLANRNSLPNLING